MLKSKDNGNLICDFCKSNIGLDEYFHDENERNYQLSASCLLQIFNPAQSQALELDEILNSVFQGRVARNVGSLLFENCLENFLKELDIHFSSLIGWAIRLKQQMKTKQKMTPKMVTTPKTITSIVPLQGDTQDSSDSMVQSLRFR